jgi:4-amino-4-deoxy-L-arabinose transferase-like glycosyltransferase
MRPAATTKRWVILSVSLFILIAALIGLTFRDYGVTWDEPIHVRYGERVYNYYASGFADHEASRFGDLRYYGAAFDLLCALGRRISPLGLYETRHLLNALVGLLGMLGCWKLARTLGGSRTAFIAALLLALTPRWWGHSFNNPKDIPFAAGYVWSIYYLVRALPAIPRVPLGLAVRLALSIGLTLAVRIGGLTLLGYLGLAMGATLFESLRKRSLRETLATFYALIGSLLKIAVPAWGVMLLFWPWAQSRPLRAPFEALDVMSHFTWRGTVLFAGKTLHATQIPRSYIPQWLFVTLPEAHLLVLVMGLGLALWFLVRGDARFRAPAVARYALVIVAAFFPIVYIAVRRTIVYDGMRHVLFIVPLFACLEARSLETAYEQLNRFKRWTAVALVALFAAYGVFHIAVMARLHPHEYVYFNRLVGGLPGAFGRYDTDYWGNSYREAVRLLVDRLESEGPIEEKTYKVFVCSNPPSSKYFFPPCIKWTRHESKADFFIATTREDCHKTVEGDVLDVVERFGTPLAYVLDRRRFVQRQR